MKSNKKGAFSIFWLLSCRYPDWQAQPWLGLVQALAEQQVLIHVVLMGAVTQGTSVGLIWGQAISFPQALFDTQCFPCQPSSRAHLLWGQVLPLQEGLAGLCPLCP